MSKNAIIASLVVLIIAGASYIFVYGDSSNSNHQSQQPETTAPRDNTTHYSFEQVEKHDDEDSCWTVIDGNVYDITPYIPIHPGGDEILRACGEDGSTLFNQRRTDDGQDVGIGLPHSSSARTILEDFQIGVVD